jgi:hypothetical protein
MYGFDLVLDDEVQHRLRAAVQRAKGVGPFYFNTI